MQMSKLCSWDGYERVEQKNITNDARAPRQGAGLGKIYLPYLDHVSAPPSMFQEAWATFCGVAD